jgi:hypothetical protein
LKNVLFCVGCVLYREKTHRFDDDAIRRRFRRPGLLGQIEKMS